MRPLEPGPHGLLTARQLAAQGFHDKRVAALVAHRRLVRLHRGVYLAVSPDAIAAGALAAVGDGAALCLRSALHHLGLRPWHPAPVHVNAPGDGGRLQREGIRIHRRRIAEGDIVEHRGLLVTSPTRTFLDVRREPRYALLRALEQATTSRLALDRPRLEASAHLREPLALFDHYGACTLSDPEAMFLFVCEDHGIARPLVNESFAGFRPDFRWPDHGLIVEVDGYEFHRDRTAFHADRERAAAYRRAGFEVVRFSAEQVTRTPDAVARTVLDARPALRRASPRRALRRG